MLVPSGPIVWRLIVVASSRHASSLLRWSPSCNCWKSPESNQATNFLRQCVNSMGVWASVSLSGFR